MQRLFFLVAACLLITLSGCSDNDTSDSNSTSSNSTSNGTASTSNGTSSSLDCSSATSDVEEVVCAADAFMATLSDSEREVLLSDFSDATAKTTWSNLPNATRNGLRFGDLSDASLAAAMTFASAVLSDDGYADFIGVLAADDYLGEQGSGGGGGPGGGGGYSADNYYIAFIGTPSATSDWMVQLGGHHMAFNITYTAAGEGYPVPHHLGVEPKESFTVGGETYAPMSEEGQAMVDLFGALDADQLSEAYLAGQMFADVLMGPDNGSGTLPTDYPSDSGRTGVLVSDLTTAQQELVTATIQQWVSDYHTSIAETLLASYTSASAYGDTYIAWGGTESAGPDPDVSGTYFRIDGPSLWIEIACQSGVVIQNQTHYHAIFRDKTMDYGGSL